MDASPAAVATSPRCRHAGVCGGCQWQHLSYCEQLERKRVALERLLRRVVPTVPAVAPVVPMPVGDDGMPWHFRHKSAFVFAPSPDGRGLVMGHFAAGGREVVPVVECPVQSARANRIAFRLRDELARSRVPAAGRDLTGVLRHLIIRTSANDRHAVAMLVVTHNAAGLKRPVRALLASPDRPDGFFVNVHDTPSPYMVGRQTVRIDGHAHVRETQLGPTFLVSPTAFFQTNPHAAAALVGLVLDAVPDDRRHVLDLYAGSGLFSLPLAARGHRVTAIEENAQALADLGRNLAANHMDVGTVRRIGARVERAVRELPRLRAETLILDPPRQGCGPDVIDAVFGRLAPDRAVYVSCDPTSLARELPAIVDAGYRVDVVRPVDMFPHTPHVEAVVVLDRSRRVPPA